MCLLIDDPLIPPVGQVIYRSGPTNIIVDAEYWRTKGVMAAIDIYSIPKLMRFPVWDIFPVW